MFNKALTGNLVICKMQNSRGVEDSKLSKGALVFRPCDLTKVNLCLGCRDTALVTTTNPRGDEPMVVLDSHLDWRFAKNVRNPLELNHMFIFDSLLSSLLCMMIPMSVFTQEHLYEHKKASTSERGSSSLISLYHFDHGSCQVGDHGRCTSRWLFAPAATYAQGICGLYLY